MDGTMEDMLRKALDAEPSAAADRRILAAIRFEAAARHLKRRRRLGWIAAAFLAGILFAEWMKRRRPSLQARVKRAAVFRGKTCQEVLDEMNSPQVTIRLANGNVLRTWCENGYSISLLFDAQDV